ncbi:hypothetical protein JHK86_047393 [Glycine max]|nr:hypothetical protein JHK86_047393 [Glycine max]
MVMEESNPLDNEVQPTTSSSSFTITTPSTSSSSSIEEATNTTTKEKKKKRAISNIEGKHPTYRGVRSSAYLNFPELAAKLPRPASTSPKDIQAAAAKASALDFGHQSHEAESELSQAVSSSIQTQSSSSSSNSSLKGVDDTFLDLPDLSLDLSHGADEFHYSSAWLVAGAEHIELGFRLEEPFLWESY